MSMNHVLGIFVIVAAYGLTWYLLLKSTKIVNIIGREGLKHTREIKSRLKNEDGGDKE
jgi:small neutral amino acid transporter SnatA (MarC family)